jgi:hypothetical protein
VIRIAKSFLSFGAIACAAALLIVSFPKQAHAVAAALVQITNTTSNPAITEDVSKTAAEIVELDCGAVGQCFLMQSNGQDIEGAYVVPGGKQLVVTAVDLYAPQGYVVYLGSLSNPYREVYTTNGTTANHYTYPSGIVFGSGNTIVPQTPDALNTIFTFHVYGYLTSN